MRKLLVFPYNLQSSAFADFSHKIIDYDIIAFISDTSRFSINSEKIKWYRHWRAGVDECDTILLIDEPDYIGKYNEIIDYALERKRTVYVQDSIYKILDNIRKAHVINLITEKKVTSHAWNNEANEIKIPVIAVMALGENSNKFYLQLMLYEAFQKFNYRIMLIGSSDLSTFFGARNIPAFLFQNESFTRKILYFNQYLRKQIEMENPDLVIIGCPGGIIPKNRYIHNYFGEIPLIVSKSAQIDIIFLMQQFDYGRQASAEICKYWEHYCSANFGADRIYLINPERHINHSLDITENRYDKLRNSERQYIQNVVKSIISYLGIG